MDIQLKFINQSADGNNSEIVLFQKNVSADMDELAVAWKVIRYCGRDCFHPFVYPMAFEVASSDHYGNFSPRLSAQNGQLFSVLPTPSGRRLVATGEGTSASEVQVANALTRGAVNVNLFKAGQLVARKTSVAPGQKAVFQFKPTLWIGVVSQVIQGEPLNSAVISSVNTELSLLGIASADIVMTGGGGGPDSQPFAFSLNNVVKA
jgi:hypothetical protein